MDVSSIPIMAALKKRMHWLSNNQSVISENIANADTPGYGAKELENQNFSSLIDGMSQGSASKTNGAQMRTNHSRHMNVGGSSSGSNAVKEAKDGEEALNGNSVVLEDEMTKLADNQMQYGMAVNLYKKNMRLLKIALGKGAGGR